MSYEKSIQDEISRNTGDPESQLQKTIIELRDVIEEKDSIINKINLELNAVKSDPMIYGVVVRTNRKIDTSKMSFDDEVVICNQKSKYFWQKGVLINTTGKDVDFNYSIKNITNGICTVLFENKRSEDFDTGLISGKDSEVMCITALDGLSVDVLVHGNVINVIRPFDFVVEEGDEVLVHSKTNGIIKKMNSGDQPGLVYSVCGINGNSLELSSSGVNYVVYNNIKEPVEIGDLVLTDSRSTVAVSKYNENNNCKYKLSENFDLGWDDICGVDEAKNEIRNSLELEYKNNKVFDFYNLKRTRGILLYGPPGCGKTLLARVASSEMAKIHGKSVEDTGYVYVKSPEILDKYVGNSEKEIRKIFELCRKHYRENGYKAILAFDEADAIMPQRGISKSSDISNTIVPMFLSEMDGIDSKQTEENPIVFLMTNRPHMLDPAVVRPGRISKHLKVGRPDRSACAKIICLNMKNVPIDNKSSLEDMANITASFLFSGTYTLYKVNNEHSFKLSDCINGAMVEQIVEMAKSIAIARDVKNDTLTGVTVSDFSNAVDKMYAQQKGMNHSYDLEDFAEFLGIDSCSMTVKSIQV